MTLEALEKRVRTLEDIEEIKKLHRFYIYCLSNQQFDDMAECFATDGVAHLDPDGLVKGRVKIAKFFQETMKSRIGPIVPHGGNILIQPVITVEGDRAKGQWIMNRFAARDTARLIWRRTGRLKEDQKPSPGLWRGKYDAEYVREKGRWKFSFLRWTMPWPERENTA